jgi:hypothetical protein
MAVFLWYSNSSLFLWPEVQASVSNPVYTDTGIPVFGTPNTDTGKNLPVLRTSKNGHFWPNLLNFEMLKLAQIWNYGCFNIFGLIIHKKIKVHKSRLYCIHVTAVLTSNCPLFYRGKGIFREKKLNTGMLIPVLTFLKYRYYTGPGIKNAIPNWKH